MAKHRLQGEWYSPDTSTVFVTCVGQIICSVRGLIGDVDRDVDTGDVWTTESGPFAEWELELMAIEGDW